MQAVNTLRSVLENQQSLETTFDAHKARLPPYEHGTLRELCSGTLRRWHYCGAVIDSIASLAARDDLTSRTIIATTLYEASHMQRTSLKKLLERAAACSQLLQVPDEAAVHAACKEALALAPRELDALQTEASALSLPEWLHARLAAETPLPSYSALLVERPDFLTVCVEPSRWRRDEYISLLRARGLEASLSHVAPYAVVVHSRPRDIASLPGLAKHEVHVQDAAQQFGPSVLSPLAAGERVLDACAAPGGKTRALLRSQPHVRVLALESNSARARTMRQQMQSSGVSRVAVECADATAPAAWWDGDLFGAVLVDAPCTGSGIARTHPEVKIKHTEGTVAALQQTQLRLLHATWPMLRPGGELLYTTCSILGAENGAVVRRFVEDTPSAALAALVPPNGSDATTLSSAEGLTFFPSPTQQGGFAAVLRKAGSAAAHDGGRHGGKVESRESRRRKQSSTGTAAAGRGARMSTPSTSGSRRQHSTFRTRPLRRPLRRPPPTGAPASGGFDPSPIQIHDDFFPPNVQTQILRKMERPQWSFTGGRAPNRFWHMDGLETEAYFREELHGLICTKLGRTFGGVERIYANGSTAQQHGAPHVDDGDVTFLYYPNPVWETAWKGSLLFFRGREVVHTVPYVPNRALLFPASLVHCADAPSASFPGLRVSLAYKFKLPSGGGGKG